MRRFLMKHMKISQLIEYDTSALSVSSADNKLQDMACKMYRTL